MRHLLCCAALVSQLASQLACMKPAPPANVYRIGDKVQVGPLSYNVLESRWRAQIGEGAMARIPRRRFLIVHLTVTNGGSQEMSLPALTIADQASQTFDESMDGREVPSWLGMLRKLKPADTLDGTIVFDVDPKSYKLRLDDGTGPTTSLVDLPLQFDAGRRSMPSPLDPPPPSTEPRP